MVNQQMLLHVLESSRYAFYLLLPLLLITNHVSGAGVQLHIRKNEVVMDNGLAQVTLSKPQGLITGIRYNGVDNLLDTKNEEDGRGYWDLTWDNRRVKGKFEKIKSKRFKVILQNESQIEISFTSIWSPSLGGSVVPLNIDKRFIMLQGSHGFYTYSIFEHLKGWPDFNLGVTRLTFKLRRHLFRYMAVDDKRQRRMPLPDDREKSQRLAYPEAVRMQDREFAGQVDDKYQYSAESRDIKVHGWMSSSPPVGIWHITPSNEFRAGGPFKQELTSHVGPTSLTVFISAHYLGQDTTPKFQNGEAWKKVFGPVFIYLNSGPPTTTRNALWQDAVNQTGIEAQSWPYSFPVSDDFLKSEQRGAVHGRLLVRDRYFNKLDISAGSAHVGLALPGESGSWQTENKGYQFWTKSDSHGSFAIENIRPGVYNLYASVPGVVGDYKSEKQIVIRPGDNIDLDELIYTPPRTGPTLWEIGYPDRSASEFFIPDPDPRNVNPLYTSQDKFRQYGLWERYTSLYPDEDLVYNTNTSDYRRDWFFAQVTRRTGKKSHRGTTWKIKFNLNNVGRSRDYTLRIALASATSAELQIRFNQLNTEQPLFTTGQIGKDNAVARHGIHGMYRLYNVSVPSEMLVEGENIIFLTQTRHTGPFVEVMYDYIRFEGPSTS